MELKGKTLLVCNCETSMPLDEGKLAKACKAAGAAGELALNSQLCRAQLGNFQAAVLGPNPVLVACTQEAPLFTEVAAEDKPEAQVAFANIREAAGWSDEAAGPDATAKIAALLAEATLDLEPTPAITIESGGVCLVVGRDEQAIEAAKQLAGRLEVTVLLSEPGEVLPPRIMDVPVFKGTVARAEGHLGKFAVTVDGYAPAAPSSRPTFVFEAAKNDAFSECDLILDLTGGTPLFPAHEKRDGYFRPDPGNPAAVQKALFDIADMVGEFEKPLYVRYDAAICAHSRSRKTGCTRCLDVCPASAITPAGDTVAIDPVLCGGCGACASVCPTGAATYQLPAGDGLFRRLRALLTAYREAGGKDAVLLLHDPRHGAEMIAMTARAGRGLPGRVLPFAVNEVTQVGLDFLAMAFAYGAAGIAVLAGPEKAGELSGLAQQIGLAETVMDGLGYGGGRLVLLDGPDPAQVEQALRDFVPGPTAPAASFLPLGGKRGRSLLALKHLHGAAPRPLDVLPLPPGAPFGRVIVETAGCTLCLSCVGACPTGALRDDETRPWLGFNEEACVQCGLCKTTCPEGVIALEPRLNFTEEARGAVKLCEEPPFHCIRCGKPFGVQRTIERIADQLAGKHWMFDAGDQVERLMMCDDCRVVVQLDRGDHPMAGPPRPAMRTTDDDLREREIEEARAKLLAERAQAGDDSGDQDA
ncbi:MAG: 4Fe-4S binding protein [Rhodospirillales bacterium]|nr:4Fe-4S binding protein [Rhodospirillales bacterium]